MKRIKSGQNRMSFDLSQGLLGNISCLCTVTFSVGFWSGRGLPYMGYIGMYRCEGYGFQAV